MAPRAGGTVYGLDGSSHRLAREIGKGGQGSVWSLDGQPTLVAKFYHNGFSPQDLTKLSAMCLLKSDRLASVAAWPLTLLKESRAGNPQGLLMRRIAGYSSVHQLYGIKSRLKVFPEAQFPFLLAAAMNIARSFATIHDAGQIIGDVNHSNLMVSQNATVAMIDCDSFQITDGNIVFPCPVGVPEFTPPELQGLNFAGQTRTTQHDSFGLSVLIFYMLFLGRHPFMGSYDPRSDEIRMLDVAIREYRFPYSLPNDSAESRLPSYVPKLSDYPANVTDLFKRAFTREAFVRGRPSALEWVSTLSSLSGAMTRCTINSNHQYFNGAKNCPWCRVEAEMGSAVFGIKITLVRDGSFNLIAVWAEIESISLPAPSIERPDMKTIRSQFTVDPSVPQIVKKRRGFRVASIGIVLTLSVLAVAEFIPLMAVLVIVAALIVGKRVWSRGSVLSKPFQDKFDEVSTKYKSAEAAFNSSAAVPVSFTREKERLAAAKAEYEQLVPLKAQKLATLQRDRKQKQLQHFLERFRLEDERVPMIGDKSKMLLYNAGILDASDVNQWKISAIDGFGPKKTEALLEWRAEKERMFRFDPSQPVDPRDLNALEQEFSQRAAGLRSSLVAGPQVLRQTISVWQAQGRQAFINLAACAHLLAKAEVDHRALRTF
jgi:DNA-binding helix-hairpin-helix protein with protein kinase domain